MFKKNCCEAYNLLRHNSNKIINLFLIMLSAGMPELREKEEIRSLQKKLNLMASYREAEKMFIRQIKEAMTTFSRRIDNAAHNWKQMKMEDKKKKALAKRDKELKAAAGKNSSQRK